MVWVRWWRLKAKGLLAAVAVAALVFDVYLKNSRWAGATLPTFFGYYLVWIEWFAGLGGWWGLDKEFG